MQGIGAIDAREGGSPPRRAEVLRVDASSADALPELVETVAQGFMQDPTWSWAFPSSDARRAWWLFCVRSALRYPCVYRTASCEAVSVWIPPGGAELSVEEEGQVPGLLDNLVGKRAGDVAELLHRFETAHPRQEPHYYLSLLSTADAHRGRGIGMALLAENLARIDADGMPAYLESSNPGNDHRYRSMGFVPVSSFQAPGGGPTVTGMWRAARRASA